MYVMETSTGGRNPNPTITLRSSHPTRYKTKYQSKLEL